MKQLVHLVENDPVVRSMLTRLLESGGHSVREYKSGSEFLASAYSLQGGCILLDVDIRGPDRFAVQRELANKAIALPVVMMSGAGDIALLAIKAGVAQFIQKPFGRSELLSVLKQLPAENCV